MPRQGARLRRLGALPGQRENLRAPPGGAMTYSAAISACEEGRLVETPSHTVLPSAHARKGDGPSIGVRCWLDEVCSQTGPLCQGCLLLMVAKGCTCSAGVSAPSSQGRTFKGGVVCIQKTFAKYEVIVLSKLVLSLIRLGTITA